MWTGEEWFVWGGTYTVWGEHDVSSGGSREGAIYDPRADRWRPVSTDGAPVHGKSSGVWTGREIVVVGTPETFAEKAISARYDPALDEWSPVAEPPSHGEWARAVAWTGTEVLVYLYQDGAWGAYDPAADSWRILPAEGAPRGYSPRAAWSGRRLLVFAWSEDRGMDGAAYDPAADSWSPLPSDERGPEVEMPEATTATWIDVGVVVWGGGQDGSEVGWFLSVPP